MDLDADTGTAAGDDRALLSTRRTEAVVAALLLAVGVVVVVESRRLGSGWTSDGPGAGYFPFLIGGLLSLSSLGTLVQAIRSPADGPAFVTRHQMRRVLAVLGPAVLYVLGVQWLGIYVASAIYIAIFMATLGGYSWAKSAVVGIAVNVVLFLMFEVWFKVPLHKGSLDPLAFLGY